MLLQISFEKASCGFLLLLNPYWKMSYMMHWQIWEVSKILENLRVQLGLPRYPTHATQSPFLWKAKRSPTPEGEKVLSNYLRWKIWKWKSDLISNCNPSPCDFQKRTRLPFPKNPPIDRQDFWRYRKLVWQWKFHQGNFSKTHLSPQPICAAK